MMSEQQLADFCLSLPGAWPDEPWEGDVVAKVGPKIFAFLGPHGAETSIGLKCGDREVADVLLERYPGAATRMPYLARYGWNSFDLEAGIDPDEIEELIDTSYTLVVARLPRSRRPA